MSWFRYVPHAQIAAYQAKGWIVDDDLSGTHHGRHAVLMRWAGDGQPS